jgi:hypothetical protein
VILSRYHRNAVAAALSIVGGALWGLWLQNWLAPDANLAIGIAAGAFVGGWAIASALDELETSHAIVAALVGMLVLSGLVRVYQGTGLDAQVAVQVGAGAAGAALGALLARRFALWGARIVVAGMLAPPLITGLVALSLVWKIGVPVWYLIWGGAFLGGALTAALVPNVTTRDVGIGQGVWFATILGVWFYNHIASDKIFGEAIRGFGAAWVATMGAKAVLVHLERKRAAVEVPPARVSEP